MRPFVFINVATSVDGKLAPENRKFVPFGSKHDLDLLYELRARADAALMGARTVDSAPGHYGPGPAKYRRLRLKRGLSEYNLRVIVSGRGTLNPRSDIFRHRFSPIIVLTSARASVRNLQRLRDVADDVEIFGDDELDFRAAFRWLQKKWHVKKILCEGGGELNMALIRQNLVDEIYLTLCPLIFGGRGAPTLADGLGVSKVEQATKLRLKSIRRIGQELFMVYRVRKRDNLPDADRVNRV
ncbi:MAG TPA: dihydrofolate reductase family protein [Verrucomicrobiae bacterium]|jgi:riboflavin-specific deaminase-like protein|nr:dihydrofolate reductase family protein [Verrucomicrobiae bacterium]